MKKFLLLAAIAVAGFSTAIGLQGCFKDTFTKTYSYIYYKPLYKTSAQVRADIKSNAPQSVERPGKIYVWGNYIFLNEVDKGIHVINNVNPAQPVNVAFIDIPGNMDLAVKGNTLYADLYTDLVAIDISNPQDVILKKVVEGVFPHRYYNGYFAADSSRVIASWEKRDTTVVEKSDFDRWAKTNPGIYFAQSDMAFSGATGAKSSSAAPYGVGGSMARFTIASNRLYTVGNSELNVFNITSAADPVNVSQKNIGLNIETIYPFRDKLFIGSQAGMFIYNINNPDNPVQAGQFSHVRSCDPVIADDDYAYVTLRSGTACQGFSNELDILQLSDLINPVLLKTYAFANPHGLAKDGSTLFVCDGSEGLKVYNASNVMNLQLMKQIKGLETYDVIALKGLALVVAEDGLYQYDYSSLSNIRLLSKINIQK